MAPKQLGTTLLLLALPMLAQASDFSLFLYFFRGLYLCASAVVLFTLWRLSKWLQHKLLLSAMWGTALAVITTPMNTQGGNGTASAAALENILVSVLGGDPIYAQEAFKTLMIAIPIWIALCYAFFYLKARNPSQA